MRGIQHNHLAALRGHRAGMPTVILAQALDPDFVPGPVAQAPLPVTPVEPPQEPVVTKYPNVKFRVTSRKGPVVEPPMVKPVIDPVVEPPVVEPPVVEPPVVKSVIEPMVAKAPAPKVIPAPEPVKAEHKKPGKKKS